MRIDLHTHSSVSDGTDSPTMLVMKARQAGLNMIALTDHDTMDGVPEAIDAGKRVGLVVVAGLEVTTKYLAKAIHLLGYGVALAGSELADELVKVRQSRVERVDAVLERLDGVGLMVDRDLLAGLAHSAATIGRPHIADAMIRQGYVADREEAFKRYLGVGKPAYVSHYAVGLERAIDLVHQAGGAAILAHPGIRGADQVVTGQVIAELVANHHLDGIEVDYPLHDAATRDLYHQIGARLGLIRTGSSDYHGTGKVGHELGCALSRETAWELLSRRIGYYGGVLPR